MLHHITDTNKSPKTKQTVMSNFLDVSRTTLYSKLSLWSSDHELCVPQHRSATKLSGKKMAVKFR